jgi:hypothetical protein
MRGQINIDVGLSDSGWRPTRWTYLEQSDGQIVRTVSVANIKWELNVDVSDVDFGLDFPRNTRVFDQRTREEWVIDSSGKKHDLANVLTTKAMADLTGERARSRSWRYILTASGACVAVAIMSVLALRKRRGKARDSL